MASYDYDLFVIGAGSGGVRAARVAAMTGAKVAVAEEHRVGGTCVIRGCVPKKFMVYASEFAHHFKTAGGYGWTIDNPRFSWTRFLAEKDKEIARLSGIYVRNLQNAGAEMVHGKARLVDANTVEVEGHGAFSAGKILIATGARVLVAEEHRVGGTCVIRGCVPKKFMVYASEFSHQAKTGLAATGRG